MKRGFVLLVLAALAACTRSRHGQSRDAPSDASDAEEASSEGDRPPAELEPLLEAHNRLRRKHCAPPLAWSDDVAKTAQRWANKLEKRGCSLDHSQSDYGENLAGGTAGGMNPERVADVWYREKEDYDFRKGSFSMDTGHFTQLVWVGTRRLGCGKATCKEREVWVCNYDPPGNVQGDYKRNVLPTSCR